MKLIAYAITASAFAILLVSTVLLTVHISVEIIAKNSGDPANPDVDLDGDQDVDYINPDEPILPINQRKLSVSKGKSGPGGVSVVLPSLAQLSSQHTRKLHERNLPYKCGVIMYDQNNPGEGGDALNEWIKDMVESKYGASSFISSEDQESKEAFLSEVEKQIQTIGTADWKIIYSHKNGLAFATDENILRSWRDAVERQNCQFIAASVFSDSLDHSIKHTKKLFAECNCSMEEFKEKMEMGVTIPSMHPWTGQLDHFLFNSGGSSSKMDIPKQRVKRGIQLLRDHLDIVLVDGQGDFAEEILRVTGWSARKRVKKASVSDGGLVYSKDLVSGFGKMSTKNGDAEFLDAVQHIYHNSLAYLMMQ